MNNTPEFGFGGELPDPKPESKRVIKISPSGLNRISSCSRSFHYSTHLGYYLPQKPDYMVEGEVAHKCLEIFYKATKEGISSPEAIEVAILAARNEIAQSQLTIENGQDMILTLRDYFSYYNSDSHLDILEVEKPFSLVLFEDDELIILLEGKIDLIAVHKRFDKLLVIDHKTGHRTQYPSMLDNQYASYSLATGSQTVQENRIVWGRPKKTKFDPATKFHRNDLTYTAEFLEEWRNSAIYWVLKADEEMKQGYHPPNYKSCKFCNYKRVCEWPSEEMRRSKLEAEFIKSEERFDLFEEE